MSVATPTDTSTSETWPLIKITMRLADTQPFFPDPASLVDCTFGHDSDGHTTVTFNPATASLKLGSMEIQNTICNGGTGSDRMDPGRTSRFYSQWMKRPDGSRGETLFTYDDRDIDQGRRRVIVIVHNPEHIRGAEVWNKATREAYGEELVAYEASQRASQGYVNGDDEETGENSDDMAPTA